MTTSTSAGVNTKKLLLGCRARFGTVRGKRLVSGPLSPPMPAGPNPLRYPVGGSPASDRETAARSQTLNGLPGPRVADVGGVHSPPRQAAKSPLRGCRPPPPDWRAFCRVLSVSNPLIASPLRSLNNQKYNS